MASLLTDQQLPTPSSLLTDQHLPTPSSSCIEYYNYLFDKISSLNIEQIETSLNDLTSATYNRESFSDLINLFSECDKSVEQFVPGLKQFDKNDECYRLSRRKDHKYIHQYNPTWVEELIRSQLNYLELSTIFDTQIRETCCNCVSIVLYLKHGLSYLDKCLPRMVESMENIKIALPDFIVRFYLDSSVFEELSKYSTSVQETFNTWEKINKYFGSTRKKLLEYFKYIGLLHKILTSDNAEIYIYFCRDIMNGQKPIERTRTYRYIPMFEDDTNVCISREADGIVSFVDCHNIKLFSNPGYHSIALITEYSNSFNQIRDINSAEVISSDYSWHYSSWLKMYEILQLREEERTSRNERLAYIDILAGMFGMKVKFTEEYRNGIISKVNSFYDDILPAKLMDEKYISSILT